MFMFTYVYPKGDVVYDVISRDPPHAILVRDMRWKLAYVP